MKTKIILTCQYCCQEIERDKFIEKATCFDCKLKKRKTRLPYNKMAYEKRRNQLRAIRESFQTGLAYQMENKILSSQRGNKYCEECGTLMLSVWKSKRFCSSKCQGKHLLKSKNN